jgi:hypothetical protein
MLRVVVGAVLSIWAVQQFATGRLADGLWIAAFALVMALPSTPSLARRIGLARPGGAQSSLSQGLAWKAIVLAGLALTLAIALFAGAFGHVSIFRGLSALGGSLVFIYLALRIVRDSRQVTDRDAEDRPDVGS